MIGSINYLSTRLHDSLIAIANLQYTFYKSKTTTIVTFAIPRLLAKHSTKFGVRCAQNGS
jgi:hypothetical protein